MERNVEATIQCKAWGRLIMEKEFEASRLFRA